MTPPNPDLHTLYDDELGERLYWSDVPLVFDGGGRLVIIPERFLSDGFSIPKMWRGLFSQAPRFIGAGLVHDWLYKIQPSTMRRKDVDRLFLYWMKALGVSVTRRRLIYWAVRVGARKSWRKRQPTFATDTHHD